MNQKKISLLIATCALFYPLMGKADSHTWENPIPPRFQWDNNAGYCGEVCFISAGLYYGQYLSQYDARAIATKGASQASHQLLLGINDAYAASQMHLNAVTWNNSGSDSFLAWVKQHVVSGYPVAIGIYTNEYLFYGDTQPDAGDPEYDHIVCATGIGSNYVDSAYHADDILYFSDNGLWGDPSNPPYYFNDPFGTFQADRQEANAVDGSIYSLADVANNYGIAITGIIDLNDDTVPVRLTTNLNFEYPEIGGGSSKRPHPMPLTLTITVSGLEPNVAYNLYRYNNFLDVPDSNFNAHASDAYQKWEISCSTGTTYTLTEQIQSDEIAVYRAVKASAP